MDQNAGKFPFVVEPFSEDFTGSLSWRFFGNQLLRCASLHAGAHGFGFDEMQRSRHVWVLSRLVVELDGMPRTGDHYTIETWVSKVYRQFTDRFFSVTGDAGRVYGYAYSVWALIDMDSREPADLAALSQGGTLFAVDGRGIPVKGPGRIRVKSDRPVRSLRACYSDLDINGHVNSIRYIEMVLDLFPREYYEQGGVRRIEMAYCAEAYLGDVLHIYTEEKEGGVVAAEIRKESGDVVTRCEVTFRNTDKS